MTEQALAVQRQPNGMELLREIAQKAGDPTVAVAVAQAIVQLQQSMEEFDWKRADRQAKIDFDDALSRCQAQISKLPPNQGRKSRKTAEGNDIFWLDYAGLDAAVRPIYIAEGFSISFSEVEEGKDNYVGMKAILSRGGVTREYFKRLTLAPAFDGMPKADAEASAASRVKRYLLLQIFNVAVGIDAAEKAPYQEEPKMDEVDAQDWLDAIRGSADNLKALTENLADAISAASKCDDKVTKRKFLEAAIGVWPDLNSLKPVMSHYWKIAKESGDMTTKNAIEKAFEARKKALGGAK